MRKSTVFFILAVMLSNFLTILDAAKPTAVVKTTSGPVRGEIFSTVLKSMEHAAFKGIRFAKPPVGYLRFKPPVPIDPWTEILNATVEGDMCTQINSTTKIVVGSEDCLFLNVYTPVTDLEATPAKLKAVMVWIYGGSFMSGSSSSEKYRPDYLLEKDVVFVSLNYRLGPLGFLGLSHPNATGNAGLKDQNLALKWVQANIKQFGGNPNNVTIFGESAGAASVGYHVLSDASAGLFHGAISMSGVPLNPWAFQIPAKGFFQAKKLGKALGIPLIDTDTFLETLYEISAAELIRASATLATPSMPPFTPTIEDASIATDVFLSKCSILKYLTRNISDVPQMLGFMDQETIIFTPQNEFFDELINYALDVSDEFGMDLSDSLTLNLESGDTAIQAAINVTSDILFIAHIDQTQRLLATKSNKNPVYYYHFSFYTNQSLHNIESNSTILGAGHADDLAYIFYIPLTNYSTDPTDPVRRTINRVSTMWTNFAKYGNPTPNWIDDNSLNITWPDSGPSGTALDIGTNLVVDPRPISKRARLIQIISWPLLPTITGCS